VREGVSEGGSGGRGAVYGRVRFGMMGLLQAAPVAHSLTHSVLKAEAEG
jgi:hypothetical protein